MCISLYDSNGPLIRVNRGADFMCYFREELYLVLIGVLSPFFYFKQFLLFGELFVLVFPVLVEPAAERTNSQ